MRTFATFCSLLVTLYINAQTIAISGTRTDGHRLNISFERGLSKIPKRIKLNYEPNGQIIKFHYDSLNIYTDSVSLFSVYKPDKTVGFEEHIVKIKNLVRKKFRESNTDTIIFLCQYIPLKDDSDSSYAYEWNIEWAVLLLTTSNRLEIFDKHGQRVKKIVTKKIGTEKDGYVRRAFINKATKEELFSQLLFWRPH